MTALIGGMILVGAIFGFSVAVVKACDPVPSHLYHIKWKDSWLIEYDDIIEASNTASAWKKLRRRHLINKPQHFVFIKEI